MGGGASKQKNDDQALDERLSVIKKAVEGGATPPATPRLVVPNIPPTPRPDANSSESDASLPPLEGPLEKLGIGPTLRWDVHGRERSGSAGRPGVRRLLPATAAIAVRVWACKKIEFPKIRLCPRRLYGCCT